MSNTRSIASGSGRELRRLLESGEARLLREAAGLSQAAIAAALGVSHQTVSRAENLTRTPGPRTRDRYLRILRALQWHERVTAEIDAGLWDHVPDYPLPSR